VCPGFAGSGASPPHVVIDGYSRFAGDRIDLAQAIEATRYSESDECVERLPLMGLLRAEGSALPVTPTPVVATPKG
jgi:hypothetical protein